MPSTLSSRSCRNVSAPVAAFRPKTTRASSYPPATYTFAPSELTAMAGAVEVRAVGADGDALGAVGAVAPADAVVLRLNEGELAGGDVPAVDGERVAGLRADVDVCAVGAHRHAVGAVQPTQRPDAGIAARVAVDGVLLLLDERECAARRVSFEHRERVVELSGGVDVLAVGADGHSRRAVQAGDALPTVALHLEEPEVAGCGRPCGCLKQSGAEPRGRGQQQEALGTSHGTLPSCS